MEKKAKAEAKQAKRLRRKQGIDTVKPPETMEEAEALDAESQPPDQPT